MVQAAVIRLSKLLCEQLSSGAGSFPMRSPDVAREVLAKGAFGEVLSCTLRGEGSDAPRDLGVVLKTMDIPQSVHDRCVLFDLFSEVSVLEHLRSLPPATTMHDFGVWKGQFWFSMEKCAGSLKEWRADQPAPRPSKQLLPVYVDVFSQIASAVAELHAMGVSHYDLKADNILLASEDGKKEGQQEHRKIHVRLADFGESLFVPGCHARDTFNKRDRGTECIKSPEMLTVCNVSRRDGGDADRLRQAGTNSQSDVWSLGCLLFEILTGMYLFDEQVGWAGFFARLSSPDEPIIPPERRRLYFEGPEALPAELCDLIKAMLVRDPSRRPTAANVVLRLQHLRFWQTACAGGGA